MVVIMEQGQPDETKILLRIGFGSEQSSLVLTPAIYSTYKYYRVGSE